LIEKPNHYPKLNKCVDIKKKSSYSRSEVNIFSIWLLEERIISVAFMPSEVKEYTRFPEESTCPLSKFLRSKA